MFENEQIDSLKGVVHDCLFSKDDGEFGVYRFEPDSTTRMITISGPLGHLSVGEHLALVGVWVDHPRFGRQFKVNSFELQLPEKEDGLIQLLGSGAIPGLGPTFAKRIVKHFGKETFDVLDNYPEKLKEVKGLGEKKRKALLEYWKGRESSRKVMLALSEAGISYRQAQKLQQAYGAEAHRILNDHPYELIKQVKGFGFQTVDRLALRMGVEADAIDRRVGALVYTLSKAEEEGHCFMPKELLLQDSSELLQMDRQKMEEALNQSLFDKQLVWVQDAILKPEFQFLERDVAEKVKQCLSRPVLVPWDREVLKKVLDRDGLKLALSQEGALETVLTHSLTIMTGGPGVGKTTLVKILVKYFEYYGFDPVLSAPTGRASQRMEEATGRSAMTLHRLLKVKGEERDFVHGPEYPLQGKVFIIDEFSMVDLRLFHALVMALPKSCQVVLVGDKDQLPSVGPGRVLGDLDGFRRGPYC